MNSPLFCPPSRRVMRSALPFTLGALLGAGPATAQEAPAAAPARDETAASTTASCDEGMPAGARGTEVPEGVIRRASTTLGTTVELGISGVTCALANRAYSDVFALFQRLDRLTDEGSADSAISKINAAAGKEPVVVDAELYALVELALGFAEHTDGAFDPTFAALSGVWRFDGTNTLPAAAEVEQKRKLVDWRKVKLDAEKRTVFLEQGGMRLGLRGIVKGYAVDKAVTLLREMGVEDFIIKSGGELFVSGNPGGGYRKVGLPDPRSDKNYALVDVRDRALNTSSDEERYFVKDGARYHHIIDPRTGRPATGTRTVSVISVDATSADALSTAVFVMGPEKGLALVERLAGVEAVIVDEKNRVHISSGLSDRIVLGAPTP